MRQMWITEHGAPDVLQMREAPETQPGPGEVRIKVGAIGVNFADIMARIGVYRGAPSPPFVPGYEVAGEIDAVGAGVDAAHVGESVLALTLFGGYSERLCVPFDQTFPRPINLPLEYAAGFPVVYLTAYAALIQMAGLKRGESVLIHAAAGGLGLAAVDIARIHDATLFGTASTSKHSILRQRGVQHPLAYAGFQRQVTQLSGGRGVDVVLDTQGGRSWMRSYRALAPGGRLVMAGASTVAPRIRRSPLAMLRFAFGTPWLAFNPLRLTSDNKAVAGVNLANLWGEVAMLSGWMEQLVTWFAEGRLHVHIDRVFPLAEAAEAHRYIQSRQNIGKVVLVP